MVSRLPLSLLASVLLVGACGLQAQTASPSWASPVNDATGQQVVATPVTPGTPALHARSTSATLAPAVTYAPATTSPMRSHGHEDVAELYGDGTSVSTQDAQTYVIPAGTLLSRGLSDYVKRYGWSMRWLVQDDYRLDAALPIPAGSVSAGVTFVVHAYQAQGGLIGDVPRFANPNKVVVIQPVTTAQEMN